MDLIERLRERVRTLKFGDHTYSLTVAANDPLRLEAATELSRLTAENAALRADAGRKDRVLRECDCPRPINSAQDESTGWCVDNGHCGCGRNHALGVRKGHGYHDSARAKESGDG